MITIGASTVYVRLKRQYLNDGKPVLKLLQFGSISVIVGTLALAYDKIIPDNDTIEKITKLWWDWNKHLFHFYQRLPLYNV